MKVPPKQPETPESLLVMDEHMLSNSWQMFVDYID